MTFKNISLILFFFIFIITLISEVSAQSYRKSKVFICKVTDKPFTAGLGAKIGDPSGLSFKLRYNPPKIAMEVTAGVAAGGFYTNYVQQVFTNNPKNLERYYIGHNIKYAYAGQGRLLYQNTVPSAAGLEWYLGLGVQARVLEVSYKYMLENGPRKGEVDFYNEVLKDIGPEGTVGFQFSFGSMPIAIFAEVNLFHQMAHKPNYTRMMGGLGVRYEFDF